MGGLVGESIASVALFGGIVLCGEAGRYWGARRSKGATDSQPGHRAIESTVLALLGLLVAFTFSGAASRFENRKRLAIDEVNAIGTAYLRLELLPESERSALKALTLRYLDSRMETSRRLPDMRAVQEELSRTEAIEDEIWRRAVTLARAQPMPIATVVLPAFNEMFDIAATRVAVTRIHQPFVVFAMLFGVALACGLLVGYALASSTPSGRAHLVLFAAVTAVAFFIIADLEHPRLGLIRLDNVDELLVSLRRSLQ